MPSPLDLVLLALLSSLAGVGFAVLVQASPLGNIPYPPFICRTCLSGWGAILASAVLLAPPLDLWLWLVLSLGGTGFAHLLFGLADGTPPQAPPLPPWEG